MTRKPELFIFAGPNGSGKTTFYYGKYAAGKLRGLEYVNPDEYAAKMGSQVSGARAALIRRKQLLQTKTSFVTETTLSGKSALKLLEEARKAGFRTTLMFIGTDNFRTNIRRVKFRVIHGGHDVPKADIVRRYHDSMKNLPTAVQKANVSHVFSSESKKTSRVFSARNGVISPRENRELPSWLPQKLAKKIETRLQQSISRGRSR